MAMLNHLDMRHIGSLRAAQKVCGLYWEKAGLGRERPEDGAECLTYEEAKGQTWRPHEQGPFKSRSPRRECKVTPMQYVPTQDLRVPNTPKEVLAPTWDRVPTTPKALLVPQRASRVPGMDQLVQVLGFGAGIEVASTPKRLPAPCAPGVEHFIKVGDSTRVVGQGASGTGMAPKAKAEPAHPVGPAAVREALRLLRLQMVQVIQRVDALDQLVGRMDEPPAP